MGGLHVIGVAEIRNIPSTSSTLRSTYREKLFLSHLTIRRRKLISVTHKYSFLTSQTTQFAFITKMNQLMLHREIAAVYCDNYKEHTYTHKIYILCCENSEMC